MRWPRRWRNLRWAVGLTALVAAAPAWGAPKVAYSPTEIHPLLIGSEVPSVEVLALDGAAVDLRQVIGKKPAVVIFYRGGW
jgi:hypothetical protein